jgi:UDP-N-acetylglucosamine 4,6-dehydratase/5-epimerase
LKYFITGGTGSFGSRYAQRLLDAGHEVTIYSRDELKQYTMAKRMPAKFVVGDVRDEARLRETMPGHDYVIHAAALKHVRTGELHPTEAVKTNVFGSRNVGQAAIDSGVKRAVILSTDKAVMPVNLYGSTKQTAEKLWLRMNDRAQIFTATRYGNVIGSSGSVLHVFDKQQHDGEFTITDHRMTRFAVSFEYAMDLVDRALTVEPGATVVSKVKGFEIVQLAKAFNDRAGFREIGIQAGEKLHEMMLTEYERARVIDAESYYLLPPDRDGSTPILSRFALTSENAPRMSVDELREVILASI